MKILQNRKLFYVKNYLKKPVEYTYTSKTRKRKSPTDKWSKIGDHYSKSKRQKTSTLRTKTLSDRPRHKQRTFICTPGKSTLERKRKNTR